MYILFEAGWFLDGEICVLVVLVLSQYLVRDGFFRLSLMFWCLSKHFDPFMQLFFKYKNMF